MIRWIKEILMDRLAAEKHRTIKMEWEKARLQQAIELAKKDIKK